jgi:hypothetical protein
MMKPIPSGLLNLTEIDPSSVVLTFRVSNLQRDKQRSTKHTHNTKDRATRTPLNLLTKDCVLHYLLDS